MEKSREIQFQALDVLGSRLARLHQTLDHMSTQANPLDAEAQLYFFLRQAEQLVRLSRAAHAELHEENSIPGEMHDQECLCGINLEVGS